MLNDLYLPDYKRLSSMIIGAPGGGKSFFVKNTLVEFLKRNDDESLRVLYCCPKQEMEFGEGSITTMDKLEKHMSKNRISVIYPDPMNLEDEVDYLIDFIFDVRESNPDFKCIFCLDDSQIFLSARKGASNSLNRLALTGRSKGVRFVSISHAPVFSKQLEGSTSYIVHFRTLLTPIHIKDFQNRYGYDPEPYVESLNEVPFSHVFFDVTTGKSNMMSPLEIKAEARGTAKQKASAFSV